MKQRYLSSVFLIILLVPVMQQVDSVSDLDSDRQALLNFANFVPHVRNLNWNSSIPICNSWVGITCDENGTRVTSIHLPGIGLFGPIPNNTIGKLDSLRVLSLRSNYLNGTFPLEIASLPYLQAIYLEHNNFSGEIPISFSSSHLIVLDLSFNSFTGSLSPLTINSLTHLTVLNLQFNSLSGSIPNMTIVTRLKQLNLSFNMFNGSVPSSLAKFPESSFMGNDFVYRVSKKKLGKGYIIGIIVACCFIILLVLALLLFCCCCLKEEEESNDQKAMNGKGNEKSEEYFGSGAEATERNKLMFFEGCSFSFNLEDLLRASAEVIGKDGNGTMYKAILDEGTTVMVKRLREVCVNRKEFEQQMETIGHQQHRNLSPLRAYYYSKDEKLLVYEHTTGGSLSNLLHGNRGSSNRTPLDWESRMNISIGIAAGILHIHLEGGVKFIHGNIKSSNIFLKEDLTPRLTDFGLSGLLTNTGSSTSRNPGYDSPEVIRSRKFNQKSDVFSFGVVILEMLTGKSPVKVLGGEDVVDLPRWVRSVVREEWTAEVFDTELMQFPNVEEEMVRLLQIGLACVAKAAELRPNMAEVVRMMEDIRQPDADVDQTSSEELQ